MVGAALPLPCTVCEDQVYPWQAWHLEHKVPLSSGGPAFELANLGPAHATCNLRKGGRTPPTPTPRVRPSRDW